MFFYYNDILWASNAEYLFPPDDFFSQRRLVIYHNKENIDSQLSLHISRLRNIHRVFDVQNDANRAIITSET